MFENKVLDYLHNIKTNVYREEVILVLLSLTLIIDAITGVMINTFGIERSVLGILFRGFLIAYFALYLIIKNNKNRYLFLIICIYVCANILISYYNNHYTIKGIIFDVIEIAKIALMPTIVLGLISMWRDRLITYKGLKRVIDISINLLLIIYIVGLVFGLGGQIYSGAGYKSVFNANNSFNIVVIVLFIFQMENTFKSKKKLDILKGLMLILILLFLGSKASIMFIPFYFILKIIIEFRNFNKKSLLKWIGIALGLALILFIIFNEKINAIINHQLYFLNKESQSIITFILSGRDKFLSVGFDGFMNNLSMLSLFLGIGSYFNQYLISIALGYPTIKNIEMDFFDILFSYGVIGVLLTFGIVIYIVVKNIKKIIKNRLTAELIAVSAMILFSFLAGHVFPDAMSATYLAIIVAMISMNGDEDIEDSNFTFRRS
ncbi:MAG: O-antigen ligase family protein [Clostridium sp.]|nr:O-antigen ligase family protein [Clostridium sp.]